MHESIVFPLRNLVLSIFERYILLEITENDGLKILNIILYWKLQLINVSLMAISYIINYYKNAQKSYFQLI